MACHWPVVTGHSSAAAGLMPSICPADATMRAPSRTVLLLRANSVITPLPEEQNDHNVNARPAFAKRSDEREMREKKHMTNSRPAAIDQIFERAGVFGPTGMTRRIRKVTIRPGAACRQWSKEYFLRSPRCLVREALAANCASQRDS
jgi:hypothetical protein